MIKPNDNKNQLMLCFDVNFFYCKTFLTVEIFKFLVT